MIEFQEWPKIARWNRDIIVTEKIDGTNAGVIINQYPFGYLANYKGPHTVAYGGYNEDDGTPEFEYLVGAQSRKRVITTDTDNFGFAKWVSDNAQGLASTLGPGRHFGEWWGSGIQRGYGCRPGERYFSLFNVKRWDDVYDPEKWPESLSIVPVLHWGKWSTDLVDSVLADLRAHGSFARFGFHNPEGVVIYHTAANEMFKVTLENDDQPKGLAA